MMRSVHEFHKNYNDEDQMGDQITVRGILPNYVFLMLQDKRGVVNIPLSPTEAKEVAEELSHAARELEESCETQRKETEDQAWTLIVEEKPPEDQIIICGDCVEPQEMVVYHNGICRVLDLEENTVTVSTKKYLVWKQREEIQR